MTGLVGADVDLVQIAHDQGFLREWLSCAPVPRGSAM